MSTGYTADIAKGISFPEFAMRCARAFGALVLMRDDSMDEPIPDEFKPSTFYNEELEKATKRLLELENMTPVEAFIQSNQEYERESSRRTAKLEEERILLDKYNAMLEQVRAWTPPTPDHQGLKDFMIQQIKSSIDFDSTAGYYKNNPALLLSGEDWLKKEKGRVQQDIEYHRKALQEEIERTNGRNQWIKDLRDSLRETTTHATPER